MARSDKKEQPTKKPTKTPRTPEEIKAAKDARLVQNLIGKKDAGGAKAFADSIMPSGALGRVSSGFDESGNRIAENQDYLNKLRATSDFYGGPNARSADVQSSLDRSANAVNRSAATNSLLDTARGQMGRSGATSDYLNRLRESTAGYTSPENQAMLESTMRDTNKAYTNQSELLSRDSAKLGIRGGAVAALQAKIGKNAARAEGEARQDIFIKNADEKQKRLLDYGGANRTAETDEFGRTKDVADLNAKAEADDRVRGNDFYDKVRDVEDTEYGKRRESGSDYFATVQGVRTDELNRGKTNLDQVAAENQGRQGLFFAGLSQARGNRNEKEQRGLNKSYLQLARDQLKSSNSRGASGTSQTKAPLDYNAYIDEKKKLIEGA